LPRGSPEPYLYIQKTDLHIIFDTFDELEHPQVLRKSKKSGSLTAATLGIGTLQAMPIPKF